MADLFDMQDEIVASLANALDAELVTAEAKRAERVLNPNAMELYLQGMSWIYKGPTYENLALARGFFERALIVDQNNIEALLGRGALTSVWLLPLSTKPDGRVLLRPNSNWKRYWLSHRTMHWLTHF